MDEPCDTIRVTGSGDCWACTCCWEHDPLACIWDTPQKAMAELGPGLKWWEEEPGVWMAESKLQGRS
jgi:hypothetical protein